MILLRIVSSSSQLKIERIAEILLVEKLAIDLNIQRELERITLVSGKLHYSKLYRLTAKTKALLFSKIDERLNQEFLKNLPEIHALPIVEMDWSQAIELRHSLEED